MSLKSRALLAVIKAVRIPGKKKLPKTQIIINRIKAKKQRYESLKKKGPRIQTSSELRYKSKQKPVSGGGSERNPQISSIHPGASEVPINQKTLGATIRRMPYIGSRESWNAEMTRLYGGIHMSFDPKRIKKSVKLLTKKKKIKKATEGGEVVVHANVDRSLL